MSSLLGHSCSFSSFINLDGSICFLLQGKKKHYLISKDSSNIENALDIFMLCSYLDALSE